jgi:hypothetical protein
MDDPFFRFGKRREPTLPNGDKTSSIVSGKFSGFGTYYYTHLLYKYYYRIANQNLNLNGLQSCFCQTKKPRVQKADPSYRSCPLRF